MGDIFFSYVEEDGSTVRDLARGLEADGYTVWYYERDSLPGVPYLLQVGESIDSCKAVVVLISVQALSSNQMTVEVVRAHESGRPFVPVLHGITHAEFQQRQPQWRTAMGSATSVPVPAEGAAAIVPRLVAGLRALGVLPSGVPAPPAETASACEAPDAVPPAAASPVPLAQKVPEAEPAAGAPGTPPDPAGGSQSVPLAAESGLDGNRAAMVNDIAMRYVVARAGVSTSPTAEATPVVEAGPAEEPEPERLRITTTDGDVYDLDRAHFTGIIAHFTLQRGPASITVLLWYCKQVRFTWQETPKGPKAHTVVESNHGGPLEGDLDSWFTVSGTDPEGNAITIPHSGLSRIDFLRFHTPPGWERGWDSSGCPWFRITDDSGTRHDVFDLRLGEYNSDRDLVIHKGQVQVKVPLDQMSRVDVRGEDESSSLGGSWLKPVRVEVTKANGQVVAGLVDGHTTLHGRAPGGHQFSLRLGWATCVEPVRGDPT